ncbi:MAG: integration host factor subunit alpha [Desulfobacteraceae bacterium]|nr:integration host factor subunit alpha [Desulfobacteraceae bacterium]
MTRTLTKLDIVERIAEEMKPAGLNKERSFDVVESLIEIMKQTMQNGDDVLISGFGKFCVKQKKKRRGRNPATGEDLMLSPRKVVTFKCSGKLRERIRRGK